MPERHGPGLHDELVWNARLLLRPAYKCPQAMAGVQGRSFQIGERFTAKLDRGTVPGHQENFPIAGPYAKFVLFQFDIERETTTDEIETSIGVVMELLRRNKHIVTASKAERRNRFGSDLSGEPASTYVEHRNAAIR